jgi:membrane protease YdiL (CAAX protease family)
VSTEAEPQVDPRAADPNSTDPPSIDRPASALRPLLAAAAVSAVVTAASYLTPERYAATAVGVLFLGATWLFVLRHDEETIRAHGLSLGGLLEPTAIDPARLAREAAIALGWALLFALVTFPPFRFGYPLFLHARHAFHLRLPPSVFDEIAGQLVVIALPEEAFFRGYLMTSLDRAWRPRFRLFGAAIGPGLFVSAAIFAVGHYLTIRSPARLAVFFPALLFGFLRARTGGIGAAVLFHALCNLFSATLGRGYGLM